MTYNDLEVALATVDTVLELNSKAVSSHITVSTVLIQEEILEEGG